MKEVLLVFIPGAGLNPSIWNQIVPMLNYQALLINYPNRSVPASQKKEYFLSDYQEGIIQQIEGHKNKRLIIIAHSLGGIFCNQLGSIFRERIIGFIAIGAVIPVKGESFLSTFPLLRRVLTGIALRIAGTRPPEWQIKKGLCSELPADIAEQIVNDFTPESISVFTEKINEPLPEHPFLYILLEKDKEIPLSLQKRYAEKLKNVKKEIIETGHLPMLSKPKLLAEHVNQYVRSIIRQVSVNKKFYL